MIKSLVKQSITAKLKRFTAASTWVGTHPFSWRWTAESGCSSSSKQPCLHQRHNKTQTQNASRPSVNLTCDWDPHASTEEAELDSSDRRCFCRELEGLGKDKRTMRSAFSPAALSPSLIPSSLPPLLFLSRVCFAHTGSLHCYSLPIIKWGTPPASKTAVKVWLSGGDQPPTSLSIDRHVWSFVHTLHQWKPS